MTSAEVEFAGGGNNPVLTISNSHCQAAPTATETPSDTPEDTPTDTPETFTNLAVTGGCRADKGIITVSNRNGVSVTVTVLGTGGYNEEKVVPGDGLIEFGGLETGTYDLTSDHGQVGVDQSTVIVDH